MIQTHFIFLTSIQSIHLLGKHNITPSTPPNSPFTSRLSISLSHSEPLLHLHEISHTFSTISSLQQSPLILPFLTFSVYDSLSSEIERLFDGVTSRLNIYHYFLLWWLLLVWFLLPFTISNFRVFSILFLFYLVIVLCCAVEVYVWRCR